MNYFDPRKVRGRVAERLLLFIAEEAANGNSVGKNRNFRKSLRNALKGIVLTFLSERNFVFELVVAFIAVILGIVLHIGSTEWAIISTNIFFVLALEVKNTSLELSVDLITSEYHYNAKGSKDAASGAVLLAALSSLCSAAFIFIPKFVSLFAGR